MKKLVLITMLAAIGFSSCKKDDDSSTSSTSVANAIKQGNWRVTLYNDSGNDETSDFSGYTFTFNTNGTATAAKGTNTVTGSWAAGTDDSKIKLLLDFGATSPFDELQDDWHVVEQTSTKIRLEDVSGGGSGTDLLTFEKN